jgi:hypothetical protein
MDSLLESIQQSLSGNNNTNNTELLQNQQITQQQINDLLQGSLMCGPSCQRDKITKELKQKYLDAESNLKTAPAKFEQSKRNYYVYSEGETGYNAIQEAELKEKVKNIVDQLTTLFNNELTNANTMNSYLNTASINSQYTIDLLNTYLAKNKELTEQLRESQSDIVTNDRKTYYESEAIENLELWYVLFWRAFYLLYIILLITLITTGKYGYAVASGIILLFYPYYINPLVKWLYSTITGLINKWPSNIYNNL